MLGKNPQKRFRTIPEWDGKNSKNRNSWPSSQKEQDCKSMVLDAKNCQNLSKVAIFIV